MKKLEKFGKLLDLVTAFLIMVSLHAIFNSYRKDDRFKKTLFIHLIFIAANIFLYQSLYKGLKYGLDYGLYFDLFAANNSVLLISLFTFKIFYLLYIIPIYLGWLLMKKVWSFVNKDYSKEQPNEEEI